MTRRLVDLSMPVHPDMLTFPRVPPPALCVYESHEDFAERIGAAEYGVTSLTGSYLVVQNDHVGTHWTRASTSSRPPAGPRRSRSSGATATACCSTSASARAAT